MNISTSCSFYYLLDRHFSAVVAVSDVFSYSGVKQDRFLWDKTHLRSQPAYVQVRYIFPINSLKKNLRPIFSKSGIDRENIGL